MLAPRYRDLMVQLHTEFLEFHSELLEQLSPDLHSESAGEPIVALRDALSLIARAVEQSLHPVYGPVFGTVEEAAPLLYHISTYMIRVSQPVGNEVLSAARDRLRLYSLEDASRQLSNTLQQILSYRPLNEAVGRWMRGADQRRATRWRDEGVSAYRLRAGVLRLGDIAGHFQVVRIHRSGTYLIAVNLRETQGERLPVYTECHNVQPPFRCFRVADWYRQLTLIRADEQTAGLMRQIPALQFAYGFAEGMGNEVEGVVDLVRNFSQVMSSIWQVVSSHGVIQVAREAIQGLIDDIMDWGRRFAAAEGPQQARLAGRLLGAAVFEIITEIAPAGSAAILSTAQRISSVLRRGRSGLRSLGQVLRHIAGSTNRVFAQARTTATLSRAARGILQRADLFARNGAELIAGSFAVGQALFYANGELVRGTIRRIVTSADQSVWIFVGEAGDFAISLTNNLRVRAPTPMGIVPVEDIQTLLTMGQLLAPVWSDIIRQRLLRTIPADLSARIARRMVNLNLDAEFARRTLTAAIRRRHDFGERLSQASETLEAIWEQEVRIARGGDIAALGEVDSLQAYCRHPILRPQRRGMQLVPDSKSHVALSHHTPEGVATYSEIPEHLHGLGRTERLEVRTLVGEAPAAAELPARIARSLRDKLSTGQLGAPLRLSPDGDLVDTWGTIIMNVPVSFPHVTLGVVQNMFPDILNALLSSGDLARVLVRQGDTWFEIIKEGRLAGAGRVMVREVGSTDHWFFPVRDGR